MKTVTMPKGSLSKSMMIGASFLLLSALLMSVSQVYYANQVQGVHPFLFTGVSFFITALLFNIIAFKQTKTIDCFHPVFIRGFSEVEWKLHFGIHGLLLCIEIYRTCHCQFT